jgi:ERCC4-type nuclease
MKTAVVGRWMPVYSAITYRKLTGFLNTLSFMAAVTVVRTMDVMETVAWISTMHSWWGKVSHKSHLSYDRSHAFKPDRILFEGPKAVQVFAATLLPGVGTEICTRVSKRFKTISEACDASPKEWASIEGIGKVFSSRIWEAIHE